jgi:transcriptional regulator with XRE-family HTH domain
MDDALSSLAWNMRRHRAIRGLSTSEVARRSQVARATLSQLESGRGNPTFDTLIAVASVLGITLAELVAKEPAPAMTLFPADTDDRADHVERFLRRFPPSPCIVDLHELRLQQGAVHLEEPLTEGVHKHIVVHFGRLAVRAGAESAAHRMMELGPGDYLVFAADCEHEYRASGEAVRATLLIHTPGGDGRDSADGTFQRPTAVGN